MEQITQYVQHALTLKSVIWVGSGLCLGLTIWLIKRWMFKRKLNYDELRIVVTNFSREFTRDILHSAAISSNLSEGDKKKVEAARARMASEPDGTLMMFRSLSVGNISLPAFFKDRRYLKLIIRTILSFRRIRKEQREKMPLQRVSWWRRKPMQEATKQLMLETASQLDFLPGGIGGKLRKALLWANKNPYEDKPETPGKPIRFYFHIYHPSWANDVHETNYLILTPEWLITLLLEAKVDPFADAVFLEKMLRDRKMETEMLIEALKAAQSLTKNDSHMLLGVGKYEFCS